MLSLLGGDKGKLGHVKYNLLVLAVDDADEYPISQHFAETNAFISAARQRNEKVLVNCAKGMSRSVTIVLAYLMVHEEGLLNGSQTYEAACKYLIEKRGVISPKRGFVSQLETFERALKKKVETSAQQAAVDSPDKAILSTNKPKI